MTEGRDKHTMGEFSDQMPAMVMSKNKPALCEQQLLLAANEEKEWGMFERGIAALLHMREQRVTPFPNLQR
mgnify:FL=1